MISIIDYGMGNLRSVQNALDYLGHRSRLIHDAGEIIDSKKLILPGVGSFREAMGNLARLGIIDAIREAGGMGTPILGICLGMQLFAEQGEEGGSCEGLGLIRGRVVRLNAGDANLKCLTWDLTK